VVALVALSAAVLALGYGTRRAVFVSQVLSVGAVSVGVLTLYGQVYLDEGDELSYAALTATALHTAVALIVLGVVVFGARRDTGLAAIVRGDAASAVLGRRMLAAAVTLPFVLGWLRLLGQDHGLYGTATGTTLLVTANAAVFAIAGFLGAQRVTRLEAVRQRAEQKLREQARTQTLMDNIPAVVFMKDRAGRFQLVNREFERVTGLDRRRVVGLTVEEIFPAEAAARMRAQDERALAVNTAVQTEDVLPGTNGPRAYLTVRFPLAEAGHGSAVCGVATDITDRVQAAAEREQLQQRLHQSERLDTLGQLAGGIAHDFNNLLASILGRAELLRDAEPGDDLSRDTNAIIQAAERGATLTRQLLIFSKSQPSHAEAVQINPLVIEAARALQKTLPDNIHLVTRISPDLLTTRIDPARLEQVIANLADNSRAAMPDGGRLTIETANTRIEHDHQPDPNAPVGAFLRLTVTDTGCGMPPEVADHAFEPFFTTRNTGQGAGLGLATVYGIVKQAGGDVTLWSRPQGGTIIHMYLPAIETSTQPTERGSAGAPADGHGSRILVVDDEDGVREIVRRILSRHGYEPVTASSGAEALRLWQGPGIGIDALITDLVMPGMSGSQLAERLRQDRPGLPVLFMSGYTSDTLPPGKGLSEQTTLLHKPFDTATLLNKLRETLHPASRSAARSQYSK
jgi:PAS domain S-box-containing protein